VDGYLAILLAMLFGAILATVAAVFASALGRRPAAAISGLAPLAPAMPIVLELTSSLHYIDSSALAGVLVIIIPVLALVSLWFFRRSERGLLLLFCCSEILATALSTLHLCLYVSSP
jgi:hypothetical protein